MPFEAGCEMTWHLRQTHTNIVLDAQTVRIMHTHLTSDYSGMGLSALAVNALMKKNGAVGRKSRIKCSQRLMSTHVHQPSRSALLRVAHIHCQKMSQSKEVPVPIAHSYNINQPLG